MELLGAAQWTDGHHADEISEVETDHSADLTLDRALDNFVFSFEHRNSLGVQESVGTPGDLDYDRCTDGGGNQALAQADRKGSPCTSAFSELEGSVLTGVDALDDDAARDLSDLVLRNLTGVVRTLDGREIALPPFAPAPSLDLLQGRAGGDVDANTLSAEQLTALTLPVRSPRPKETDWSNPQSPFGDGPSCASLAAATVSASLNTTSGVATTTAAVTHNIVDPGVGAAANESPFVRFCRPVAPPPPCRLVGQTPPPRAKTRRVEETPSPVRSIGCQIEDADVTLEPGVFELKTPSTDTPQTGSSRPSAADAMESFRRARPGRALTPTASTDVQPGIPALRPPLQSAAAEKQHQRRHHRLPSSPFNAVASSPATSLHRDELGSWGKTTPDGDCPPVAATGVGSRPGGVPIRGSQSPPRVSQSPLGSGHPRESGIRDELLDLPRLVNQLRQDQTDETQSLRAEVQTLRAEIHSLRADLSAVQKTPKASPPIVQALHQTVSENRFRDEIASGIQERASRFETEVREHSKQVERDLRTCANDLQRSLQARFAELEWQLSQFQAANEVSRLSRMPAECEERASGKTLPSPSPINLEANFSDYAATLTQWGMVQQVDLGHLKTLDHDIEHLWNLSAQKGNAICKEPANNVWQLGRELTERIHSPRSGNSPTVGRPLAERLRAGSPSARRRPKSPLIM